MRRLLAAICIATGLLTFGGTATGRGLAFADVGNGNSANAQLCQQGGYLQLQTSGGGAFANQDECVSYGAQGGTLYHPMLMATSSLVPPAGMCGALSLFWTTTTNWCIAATGSGFHPNSPVTVTIVDSPGGSSTFPFESTDGSGRYVLEHFGSCPTFLSGAIETITVTDAEGLHATASASIAC